MRCDMLDWEYLIKKYGPTETPHKFEEIALAYVRDVYPQYSWYPTRKTRDGNKDAQRKEVYFGEDNSFDVWEEAKFKGTGKSLRRQDIDPTILSGLIQGNVRLIIFVTNAPIPDELLDRAILGARIKGMKVSCVLADQLESWLILHPYIFNQYWDSYPNKQQASAGIIWIPNVSFFDMVSNDFKPFNTRKMMLTNNYYLLTVSISSNIQTIAVFYPMDDFPFDVVKHPNYDDPEHLIIELGLSTFALLLKAKSPFSGGVNIRFKIDGTQYSRVSQEVEIVANPSISIVYAQQMQLIDKIKAHINTLPNGVSGSLITIYASSGMGKSFVLRNIYEEFGLKRDMTIVAFDSDKNAFTNYMLLCRIVLFLYYGNIFWENSSWSREGLEQQKKLAVQNNNRELFDDSSLGSLFDGCLDACIAKDIVEQLARKKRRNALVHTRTVLTSKILLLDDFQYLNKLQANFICHIFDNLNLYQGDCIVILSATKGNFSDRAMEARFLGLTANSFNLNGLTYNDMAGTLGGCFGLSPRALRRVARKILSPSPLLTRELLQVLQEYINGKTGNIFQMICAYSASKEQTLILKNRFCDLQKQYYLLDIVYRFKKGVPTKAIIEFSGFANRSVQSDLNILAGKNLVYFQDDLVFPYHDYYVKAYIQLRKSRFHNALTGRFLSYLISIQSDMQLVDTNQILSMLLKCGKKYLHLYESKVKDLIHYYMQTTQFGAALHFCSHYYHLIENREPNSYTSEEYYYLFSYAYCLVHCGNQNLANQLLETIYTFAKDDVPEKYMAGAELLSQNFWAIKLDGLINNSFFIQSGAYHMLQSGQLSQGGRYRIEQAYDTCFNRRMVTYLLIDQRKSGQENYAQRLKLLAQTYHGDDFRSHSATLIMDYARGISFFAPQLAERLLKIALDYFSCQAEEHYRRILLCKIDYLLLRCINGDDDAFWDMEPLIERLLQGGFSSEYFKAVLKRCACRTILWERAHPNSEKRETYFAAGSSQTLDALEEISNALLESGLSPEGRDCFLLNNLLAYYSICNRQYEKAIEYLQEIAVYVRQAGMSYQNIVAHNCEHINTISHISWCTVNTPVTSDTFLLDCRFW